MEWQKHCCVHFKQDFMAINPVWKIFKKVEIVTFLHECARLMIEIIVFHYYYNTIGIVVAVVVAIIITHYNNNNHNNVH